MTVCGGPWRPPFAPAPLKTPGKGLGAILPWTQEEGAFCG